LQPDLPSEPSQRRAKKGEKRSPARKRMR
jgi:hypothetical protein